MQESKEKKNRERERGGERRYTRRILIGGRRIDVGGVEMRVCRRRIGGENRGEQVVVYMC